ncbi:MAG: hypothetical protein IJD38_12910, partial [Clostridia bacterium]|nr:hypothetical protein [Clostridia bacterium]
MKRFIPVFLLFLFVTLLLTACRTGTGQDTDASTDTDVPVDTAAPTEEGGTTAEPTDESTVTDTDPDTDPDTQPEDTSPAGVVMADVYPTPTEITYEEGYVVTRTVKPNEAAAEYVTMLADHGITVAEDGLPLTVTLRELTELAYGADESYILHITQEGITIEAQTERGVHYAFMTLIQLI